MLGTVMKYKDTQFDVLVLSEGGDFDESTSKERQDECRNVWKDIDNIMINILLPFNSIFFVEDTLLGYSAFFIYFWSAMYSTELNNILIGLFFSSSFL